MGLVANHHGTLPHHALLEDWGYLREERRDPLAAAWGQGIISNDNVHPNQPQISPELLQEPPTRSLPACLHGLPPI